MTTTRPKSLNWFLRRIWTWKRITRDSFNCKCSSCIDIETIWMEIFDKQHADVLYTTQCDFLVDWVALNYRDYNKPKKPKKEKRTYKSCRYCKANFDIVNNMQYCCKEHSELWTKLNKKKNADAYNKPYYHKNKVQIMERRLAKKNQCTK